MSVPVNDVEVAAAAMATCGLSPLQSFSDATEEVVAIDSFYETIVQTCLSDHPWGFAKTTVQLARKVTDPDPPWLGAYSIPNPKPLRIRTVRIGEQSITYEQFDDQIRAMAEVDDVVIMEYTRRIDVMYWPPAFVDFVVLRLASRIAGSILEKHDLSAEYASQAEERLARVRNMVSQGETTKRLRPMGILSARRGGAR